MINPQWLIIPLVSGGIGWFTNWIAIKMLFHPQEPISILGLKIQGVFPKRRSFIAEQIGVLVAEKLINTDEILQSLHLPQNIYEIKPDFDTYFDAFLRAKLKENFPLMSMFISEKNIGILKKNITDELNILVPEVVENFTLKINEKIDVKALVTEKVNNFSLNQLEEMLQDIINHELRFVEIVGAVLGFIIGILNVLLLYFI